MGESHCEGAAWKENKNKTPPIKKSQGFWLVVGQEGEVFILYLIKAVPWVYRAPQVDVWVFEDSP